MLKLGYNGNLNWTVVFLSYWKIVPPTVTTYSGRLGRSQWVFIKTKPQHEEEEEEEEALFSLSEQRWLCQPFFVIRTDLLLLPL